MAQRKNIQEQVMAEGRQIAKAPAESLKSYSLMLAPSIMERLREHAQRRGLSLGAAVRQAVSLYMEKEGLL